MLVSNKTNIACVDKYGYTTIYIFILIETRLRIIVIILKNNFFFVEFLFKSLKILLENKKK